MTPRAISSLKLTFLASSGSSNSRPEFHTVPQTPTSTGLALFIDASLPFSRELGSANRERRPNLEISVGAGAATAAAAPKGRDVEPKGGGASLLRGRDVARGGGESARGGAAGRDLLNAGIVRWPRSHGTEATAHARRRRWAGSRAPVTNRLPGLRWLRWLRWRCEWAPGGMVLTWGRTPSSRTQNSSTAQARAEAAQLER